MTNSPNLSGPYQPNWDSLISYGVPDWMIDAKFGLYAHWGLYSVPGFGNEWYGKWVYDPTFEAAPAYQQHIDRYGPLSKFGYKDFVPMFMAEKYDADAWADLMQASGAKYGGFSLAHHDGYGLWDSDVYEWNVGKMGPKRDLYGELVSALRQRGLRIVAPFHIVRGYNWYLPGWDQFGKQLNHQIIEQGKREKWDLFDPAYADFYWNQEVGADYEEFLQLWVAKVIEVWDRYQPDVTWFDSGEFRGGKYERHTLELLCHYLNRSVEWGKGVTVLNKMAPNEVQNFDPRFGVLNYEAGRSRDDSVARPWNDDLQIGDKSWGWVENQTYLTGKDVLNNLIDRVARGGSLMLSLSPKADGTIPEGQQQALRDTGAWLNQYGESIYNTRGWKVHGEGDDARFFDTSGKFPKWVFKGCTADDKRYTQSKDGNTLYAFALGQPNREIIFESLGGNAGLLEREIRRVGLLGGAESDWAVQAGGLVINTAGVEAPDGAAVVWKVEFA
ncbi:MAG: alpha-L-fucosidase [Chloroflexota bacterium]